MTETKPIYLYQRDSGDEHRPLDDREAVARVMALWTCACCGVPLAALSDAQHRCPDCLVVKCLPTLGVSFCGREDTR